MRVVVATHNRLGQVCIETLHAGGAEVAAVYTRPPTPAIADQIDLSTTAEAVDAPLHVVESLNTPSVIAELERMGPTYLFVVGWSQLVEQAVIDTAAEAAIGMHPAPLPRGRGRAPLAWALIKGLDRTALTIFELTEAADAGPIIAQEPIEIDQPDHAVDIYERMLAVAGDIIDDVRASLHERRLESVPQDESRATYWPRRRPQDGAIPWSDDAQTVFNWVRGQSRPYPGAYTSYAGEIVSFHRCVGFQEMRGDGRPGQILHISEEKIDVATWEGCVSLGEPHLRGDSTDILSLVEAIDLQEGDLFQSRLEAYAAYMEQP